MPVFSYDFWRVPAEIRRMLRTGEIQDWSSRDDGVPSFGARAADGNLIRLWVGHPDEMERIGSGYDERYAVTAQGEPKDDPTERYLFRTAKEAVSQWRLLLEMHDGPMRRLRLLGE